MRLRHTRLHARQLRGGGVLGRGSRCHAVPGRGRHAHRLRPSDRLVRGQRRDDHQPFRHGRLRRSRRRHRPIGRRHRLRGEQGNGVVQRRGERCAEHGHGQVLGRLLPRQVVRPEQQPLDELVRHRRVALGLLRGAHGRSLERLGPPAHRLRPLHQRLQLSGRHKRQEGARVGQQPGRRRCTARRQRHAVAVQHRPCVRAGVRHQQGRLRQPVAVPHHAQYGVTGWRHHRGDGERRVRGVAIDSRH